MAILETQMYNGKSFKKLCDFCDEEPENGVLIEKPNSMIVKGDVILSVREQPLHICLDCLTTEIENI